VLDPLIGRSLPVAAPYLFTARAAAGESPAVLSGNAPSAEAATQLIAAFNRASGGAAPEDALSLAQGIPSETWPTAVAAALDSVDGLEDWSVVLSDRTATVSGIAADRAASAAVRQRLSDWAGRFGFDLTADVAAGPVLLPVRELSEALAGMADCGALTPDLPAEAAYPLGATIRLTGDVAQAATAARIAADLDARIGDRRLAVETTTLNDQLCAVRKVLPDVPNGDLSIWMGNGETGAPNLTGVFHAGENPVVEVHAPASLTDGSLWVALIDNTGKVFNVLPNINAEEHDLIDIGVMDNGVRRVRVLHALAELQTDRNLLAFKVTEGDFGKSEIVAILSRRPLFDVRRPRDESVASFAEALAEIQQRDPGNIIALASRLLDSRP
jgi:hypothetical protein